VLQVVAERRIRGAVERTYTLRLYAAQIPPGEVAAMTSDEHAQAFVAYVAGLLADFDRYLAAGVPDPVRDGAAYRVAAMWLTDAEFADFLRGLQELALPRLAKCSGRGAPAADAVQRLSSGARAAGHRPRAREGTGRPQTRDERESMMAATPAATSLAVLEMAQAG
jgi:hypothetical protein